MKLQKDSRGEIEKRSCHLFPQEGKEGDRPGGGADGGRDEISLRTVAGEERRGEEQGIEASEGARF